MDDGIKRRMEALFTTEEVRQIEDFIGSDRFSEDGEEVVATIFLYAKYRNRSVADVLAVLEKIWKENWNYQHPDIRGSRTLPGKIGMRNRAALENVCGALNMPLPSEENEKGIPTQPFKVVTWNSTYIFGVADEKGERDISRKEKPLEFNHGRILHLALGFDMTFQHTKIDVWETTPVIAIEPVSS
jgi:hypothetical protein